MQISLISCMVIFSALFQAIFTAGPSAENKAKEAGKPEIAQEQPVGKPGGESGKPPHPDAEKPGEEGEKPGEEGENPGGESGKPPHPDAGKPGQEGDKNAAAPTQQVNLLVSGQITGENVVHAVGSLFETEYFLYDKSKKELVEEGDLKNPNIIVLVPLGRNLGVSLMAITTKSDWVVSGGAPQKPGPENPTGGQGPVGGQGSYEGGPKPEPKGEESKPEDGKPGAKDEKPEDKDKKPEAKDKKGGKGEKQPGKSEKTKAQSSKK